MTSHWADPRFTFIKKVDLGTLHDEKGNADNLTLLLRTWVALLLESPVDPHKPLQVIKRWLYRMRDDLKGQTLFFSSVADALTASAEWREDGVYVEPLHHLFCDTPLFREYNEWYKSQDDSLYDYLLSFLWFGKKAEFEDPELQATAFRGWQEVEEELSHVVIPDHVAEDLKYILDNSGFAVDIQDFKPKHGPGKVAERSVKSFSQKNKSVRFSASLDPIIDILFDGDLDFHSWVLLPDPSLWLRGRESIIDASILYSLLRFAKKNQKTARSICMEPVPYMYFQQGVMSCLNSAVKRSRLGLIIQPESQEKNRKASLLASLSGEFSTLDLSAASDRMLFALVQKVFSGTALELLVATRTSKVKVPDGSLVEVKKFAPMGSACCFPVQSIVFALCAILCDYLSSHGIRMDDYLRGEAIVACGNIHIDKNICVYGDDIIIRNCQSLDMISLLSTLGFKVNSAKSFFGAKIFRESCGIFCMRGRDVTPVMFAVKHLLDKAPGYVQSCIDLANRLFDRGYFFARQIVLDYLDPSTYVESSMSNLPHHAKAYYPSRLNLHTVLRKGRKEIYDVDGRRYRWNRHLQRLEVRIRLPYTPVSPVSDDQTQRYLYNRWIQEPTNTVGSKPPVGDTGKPVLRWGWTPT